MLCVNMLNADAFGLLFKINVCRNVYNQAKILKKYGYDSHIAHIPHCGAQMYVADDLMNLTAVTVEYNLCIMES